MLSMLKCSNCLSSIMLMVICVVIVPVSSQAISQGSGTSSQTLLDGGAPELTPEEKIAELNAKLLENPANAAAWNDLGIVYAGENQFGLAKDAFIKAVQSDPAQGDYHRNLGASFVKLEMFDLAISEFMAYRQLDIMGGVDYWRLIGNAQIKSGQVSEARKTLQEGIAAMAPHLGAEGFVLVLMLDKVEAEAEDEVARRKHLEAQGPAAVKFLETAREGDKGFTEAQKLVHIWAAVMIEEGKLLEDSEMLDEAAEVYTRAYELAPDRNDLLPRLVSVHIARGEMMDAKVAARLARADHPQHAGTWIASGRVYERVDRNKDALECYKKAFAIDDSIEDLRIVIGNLLMRMGRDSEATVFLKDGVAPGSAKPEVVYNYAVSQMREKKYHAAIAALKSVVVDKPEMTEAWIALGQSYQATKQYTAAIEPYGKALDQTQDPKYAVRKGRCAQKAKHYDEAIAAYKEGLVLDPVYIMARYNLSLTYMEAKQFEKAIGSFQLLLELEPQSYRAYFSMGRSYYHLGRYDEALDAFDMAMEEDETANLFNSIGLVYDKQGKKKKAEFWYKKAKKL